MAEPAVDEQVRPTQIVRGRLQRNFYASPSLSAEADHAGVVRVDVSLAPMDLAAPQPSAPARRGGSKPSAATTQAAAEFDAALRGATERLRHGFEAEFTKVVDAYRGLLRESLARADDPRLQTALNRARLQEKVLASTSMVDQAQACQLLGFSGANPSATMKRKEDKREVLRFTIDGRAAYPLFQFNVEARRLSLGMARLIARKPERWSDFRLLHWLTRPHLDFSSTPAEALETDDDGVVAAFDREVEASEHG